MPKLEKVLYVYSCEVCGEKYRDEKEEVAKQRAKACEEKQKRWEHAFKVGEQVTAYFCAGFQEAQVTGLMYRRENTIHVPWYIVRPIQKCDRSWGHGDREEHEVHPKHVLRYTDDEKKSFIDGFAVAIPATSAS